jgi:hypothetical protein
VLVVRETTSELEMRDLDHLVICQCRKHQHVLYLKITISLGPHTNET